MKRIPIFFAVLCIAISIFIASPAAALPPSGLWTDGITYDTSASFNGGTGTSADPYLLSSAEDLAQLSINVNNGRTYAGTYFKLTADVDLAEKYWIPIGTVTHWSSAFSGHFDGGGHIVSNMTVLRSKYSGATNFLGFFAWCYNGASVRNLGLVDAKIIVDEVNGLEDVGLLMGYADNGVTIDSCFASGSISASVNVRGIGGLVGQNYNGGSISNCYFIGSIDALGGSYVGGIIGYQRSASPTNCYVAATINSTASFKYAVAPSATNSYYDNTLNSTVTGGGGVAKTTAEMKTADTAALLNNGGSVWEYDAVQNYGYPKLGIFTLEATHVHVWQEIAEVASSCTVQGNNHYWKCSDCGKYYKDDKVTETTPEAELLPLAAHTLTEYPALAASHFAPGNIQHWICDACGKYFSDSAGVNEIDAADIVIAQIPHSFGVDWEKDADSHWHECACGIRTNVGEHSFGDWVETIPATETTKGEKQRDCSVCGYAETAEIPELEHIHIWLEIPAKAPLCLTPGNNQYFYCSACGKYYKSDKLTETTPESEELPLLAHCYSTVWSKDESGHWHECECGSKSGFEVHTFGTWVVTKKATTTKKGSQERSCSVCGYKEYSEIPARGDAVGKPITLSVSDDVKGKKPSIAPTGDDSIVLPWLILLLISGVVVSTAGLVVKRRD